MTEDIVQNAPEHDLVNEHLETDQESLAQSVADSEELAHRIILLHEIASELNRAKTIDETLELTARMMSRVFKAKRASVTLLSDSGDQFSVTALHGENGAFSTGALLPVEGTLIGVCIQQKKIRNTPDIQLVEDKLDAIGLLRQGMRTLVSAPLITGERVIGTLNLSSNQVNAFTGEDESLLTTIATFLSATIYNQQLYQTSQHQAKRDALVNEISQKIQNTSTIDDALQVTVQEIGRALQARHTYIQLKTLQD